MYFDIYINVYIRACTYIIYICTYIHLWMRIYACKVIFSTDSVATCIPAYKMYIYMYIVDIYVYIFICKYIHVYKYI